MGFDGNAVQSRPRVPRASGGLGWISGGAGTPPSPRDGFGRWGHGWPSRTSGMRQVRHLILAYPGGGYAATMWTNAFTNRCKGQFAMKTSLAFLIARVSDGSRSSPTDYNYESRPYAYVPRGEMRKPNAAPPNVTTPSASVSPPTTASGWPQFFRPSHSRSILTVVRLKRTHPTVCLLRPIHGIGFRGWRPPRATGGFEADDAPESIRALKDSLRVRCHSSKITFGTGDYSTYPPHW
jgi:hypothetical protein